MDDAIIAALYRHRTPPVTLDGRPLNVEYTYTIRPQQPGQGAAPGASLLPPYPNVAADAVLAALLPRLRECYVSGLVEHPTMAGRFVYIVAIEIDGSVGPVGLRPRDPADAAAEVDVSAEVLACVTATLRSAKFAAPPGGHPAAIEVPITLAP